MVVTTTNRSSILPLAFALAAAAFTGGCASSPSDAAGRQPIATVTVVNATSESREIVWIRPGLERMQGMLDLQRDTRRLARVSPGDKESDPYDLHPHMVDSNGEIRLMLRPRSGEEVAVVPLRDVRPGSRYRILLDMTGGLCPDGMQACVTRVR